MVIDEMSRILIVDDSKIMRKSLAAILTEAGHTIVAEAGNGLQACKEFEKHRPDLVTMDIDMPYVNGLEALKVIMGKHPKANIVMVSSESSSRLICEVMSIGAKAFIIKPFYISELLDTVNNLLHFERVLEGDSLQKIYKTIQGL